MFVCFCVFSFHSLVDAEDICANQVFFFLITKAARQISLDKTVQ